MVNNNQVVHELGLGGLCPKKAVLCYAAMPAGSSIMLNLEAYYAGNMPTVCLRNFTTVCPRGDYFELALMLQYNNDLCNHRRQSALNLCSNKELFMYCMDYLLFYRYNNMLWKIICQ